MPYVEAGGRECGGERERTMVKERKEKGREMRDGVLGRPRPSLKLPTL